MCRNIKPLFNFEPPATDTEIHEAALQFVRKISGSNKPSMRNKEAFDHAVRSIANAAQSRGSGGKSPRQVGRAVWAQAGTCPVMP